MEVMKFSQYTTNEGFVNGVDVYNTAVKYLDKQKKKERVMMLKYLMMK